MSLGWLTLLHLSAVELAALRDRGKTNKQQQKQHSGIVLFRIAGEMTSVPSWLCKRQEVLASLHLSGKREWDQAEFYKLLFFSRLFKNLFCTRAALTAFPLWYGMVLRKEAMTKGG